MCISPLASIDYYNEVVELIQAESGAQSADDWAVAIALRNACRAFILRHCGEPDLAAEPDLGDDSD